MRHLFIVAREHPWLYGHLRERFEDDADVDVILDRRVGERRTTARETSYERRNVDRRRPLSENEDLRVRSHYIVEL